MGNFELFTNRSSRQTKEPTATVQARGAFTLNAAAMTRIGEPKAVHLYFDAEGGRVGIKEAEASSPYAYNIRPVGKGSSGLISAKSFMDSYRISYEKTTPVQLSFEDDMAILDVAYLMEKSD